MNKKPMSSVQQDMQAWKIMMEALGFIPETDCIMCDKGQPPRKARVYTSEGDYVCPQCAKEYQDAEDALANGAHE